jgi:hypothetical protein
MYSEYGSVVSELRDLLYNVNSYNAGLNVLSSLLNLAVVVLTVVALWMIFEKAGEPGWKAVIPFYNSYILYKISGKKNLFWGALASSILCFILAIAAIVFAIVAFVGIFTGEYEQAALNMLLCTVGCAICAVVTLVFRILQSVGLTKAFEISGGYAVGLVLIPVVFYCILAFNSNMKYYGFGYHPVQDIPVDPSNPYFQ